MPYLDNDMLNLADNLAVHLKIAANGETKMLSRRLVGQLLPPDIAAKPKHGFGLPLDRWLGARMREFLRELLLGPQRTSPPGSALRWSKRAGTRLYIRARLVA